MVGLSVVLEAQKFGIYSHDKSPQVINKATIMLNNKPSSSSSTVSPPFLDHCFLCSNRLLPGKDIYMYKGDKGFCSVECRYKQIFMDEEESIQRNICSFSAMKTPTTSSASASSSSSSQASSRGHRKGPTNRAAGGFAY